MNSITCLKKLLTIMFVSSILISMTGTLPAECMTDWTFMVYMNADNDLDMFGEKDFEEMERAGSNASLNILVQIDRANQGAKRYLVKRKDSGKSKSQLLEDLGEIDSGNYKELVSFVRFAKNRFPARNYCLVIWNHGSGWKRLEECPITRGISYDFQSGNHITTVGLGKALKEIRCLLGKKLDILAMDACLMAMLEIAVEVMDGAELMVASEEVEPANGYDYAALLVGAGKLSPEEFAKKIVDSFAASYSSTDRKTTQSALRLSLAKELSSSVNNLAGLILENMNNSEIRKILRKAGRDVTRFKASDYADLIHFVSLIHSSGVEDSSDNSSPLVRIKAAARDVLKIGKRFVLHSKTTGPVNAYGVSIFLPGPYEQATSEYKKLRFAILAPSWVELTRQSTGRSMEMLISSSQNDFELDDMNCLPPEKRKEISDGIRFQVLQVLEEKEEKNLIRYRQIFEEVTNER